MKKVLIAVMAVLVSGGASAADWYSSYKNDEMRGTAQKFIETESDNTADFEFPYNGGSKMTLLLRSKKTQLKEGQKAEDLPFSEAILTISKGQFICHSFDDCHVSVKFDNGNIQKFSMSEAAGGRSDVIFFDNSASFIKNIKKHKKLILEADFYQAGPKQFKFDLSGFDNPKS
ncbi:MAG: hypothetical protein E7H57_13420 [Pantoea sp.]|nr:hypothetical protein [Pantoea sp.]